LRLVDDYSINQLFLVIDYYRLID